MRNLSPRALNDLRIAVVEEFADRFAVGAVVVHTTCTQHAASRVQSHLLADLGISTEKRQRLPDVVLYDVAGRWLYAIDVAEIMTAERAAEVREILGTCAHGRSLVTAFPDRTSWGEAVDLIAWETAVWLAEEPEHLVFYNAERFLMPAGSK